MSEPQSVPSQSEPSQTPARGGSQGARRSRGGRGRNPRNGGSAPRMGDQPTASSEIPQPGPPSTTRSEGPSEKSRGPRRDRGRRGGSARGPRGGAQVSDRRPGAQRSFGGHLTTDAASETSETTPPSLSGNAPEFVPGQPVPIRTRTSRRQQTQPKLPKSQADDLSTRIHEDISNSNYECAICTDDVLRKSNIWSCTLCWTVVHMKCVKRWYENQKKQENQSSEPVRELFWRCPGCNSKLVDDPGTYRCWCGKDINPQPAPAYLPPHSCGQTCSKPRPTCPHPCSLQCHAGPCPPCDLMGPVQSCFCGKNTSQKLCRETDYENGWSCQETCDDQLPCWIHTCSRPCHPGLCGDCEAPVEATCYCGKVEKELPCSQQEEILPTFVLKLAAVADGSFHCDSICAREFDCGKHKCMSSCHPQDEEPAHCPYSPDVVSRCPCGKTPLAELVTEPRKVCEDKIPHCEEPCGKVLPCGHICRAKCHTGDCGFCNEMIDLDCRCGRTQTASVCHQGDVQHPWCMRVCQANLSCGRHKCQERCCPGEKKAAERQAARRKHKISSQTSVVEAEHICIRTCDRLLKCRSHHCEQMCHRGPCGTCPEAVFTEISCNCGRTVLQPPQPCGTLPPECRFNCSRRPTCGHPPVEHNCHGDDVSCPKCPFLVDKWCICGKEKLHSQPCHLQEPRCGKPCGKKLKCGLHNCRKLCHREGDCEDVTIDGGHCSQPCGKTKMFCEHSCQKTCHGQTPCNESKPCNAKARLTCPCGQHKQEVNCLASSSNPTPSHPELKCDDECLRLERNRKLAAALNIDPATHTNDHVPYSDTTLKLYKESLSWAESQERQFRVFSQSPTESSMRYKPMPSVQRQFLHVLAEDYGLESKSEDVEPHRYVIIFKGRRFVSAPGKTLAQCIKIREKQAAEAAATAAAELIRSASPLPGLSPDLFNGFILTVPRFGLTIDDVKAALASEWSNIPGLHFVVDFLPSDEVLLRASTSYSASLSPAALEQALTSLKPGLLSKLKTTDIAGNIILCHAGEGFEILRRENLVKHDGSGWSAVAGRAASRSQTPAAAEEHGRTAPRKLLGLKKKLRPAEDKKEKPWDSLGRDVEC